jgi:ribose transport system substrate-binding protein
METKRMAAVAAACALGAALLGCGSSQDNGSAKNAAASGTTTGTAAGSGVTGVPPMSALYHGSESPPPTAPSTPAKGKTVWWLSCGQSVPDCAQRSAAAVQAGKTLGWNVRVADTNVGANNGYETAIKTALAAHPSAIVQDAFSCSSDQAGLIEAKNEGIPVLGAEALDCSPSLFTVPIKYNATVQSGPEYWKAFGKLSADYVINATQGKAKIIANLGKADPEFELLNSGFLTELKKCSGCSVSTRVDWVVSDLVPNGAWINSLRAATTKDPTANAVYFPFDFMATTLGGSQALRTSGIKATMFGGTGGSDTMDLIRNGLWTADTEAYDLNWMGWAAMDTLNRYFDKQPAVPEGVGFVVVDKSHNLPAKPGTSYATQQYDYVAAYKKAWGVH